MATLHVRNVPADLDAALVAEAASRGLSKNRQAIEVLRRGLGFDQVERSQLVGLIRQHRHAVDVDVSQLIRGDRPADGG